MPEYVADSPGCNLFCDGVKGPALSSLTVIFLSIELVEVFVTVPETLTRISMFPLASLVTRTVQALVA